MNQIKEQSLEDKAKEWVEKCLRDTTPKDVPLPFKQIIKAKFVKAKNPTVRATLEMVDGYKARIEVSRYSLFPENSRWSGGGTAWRYTWLSSEEESYLYWNRDKKTWTREVLDWLQ